MRVVVIGAGVTGLGCALACARRGHSVTLLDWDRSTPPDDSAAAFDAWDRPGVAHFRLPHLFLALGRRVLRDEYPDVLAELHAGGAADIDFRARVPGGAGPEDNDLVGLACRRPFFETVLRRIVEREPRVVVRTGARVESLEAGGGSPPVVTGVRMDDGASIPAELVVDASGRSTRIARWLDAIGAPAPSETMEPCGLVYNCRYFRFRDGHSLPTQQSLFGPRGEVGNVVFATFPGEGGTWALSLSADSGDRELRPLRHIDPFMAAARAIAPIAPLLDPDVSLPVSGVLTMGELRNVHRPLVVGGAPLALGILSIGDALAHTDPSFGWGLSMGLANGAELARVIDEQASDLGALAEVFDRRVGPEAAGRVRASIEADRARARRWRGEAADTTTPAAEFASYLSSVLLPLMPTDAAIFRAVQRRGQLLDPIDALQQDPDIRERAAAILAERGAPAPRPPAGPPREELAEIIRRAEQG